MIFTKKDNDMSNLQSSYSKVLSLLHEIEANKTPRLTAKAGSIGESILLKRID